MNLPLMLYIGRVCVCLGVRVCVFGGLCVCMFWGSVCVCM